MKGTFNPLSHPSEESAATPVAAGEAISTVAADRPEAGTGPSPHYQVQNQLPTGRKASATISSEQLPTDGKTASKAVPSALLDDANFQPAAASEGTVQAETDKDASSGRPSPYGRQDSETKPGPRNTTFGSAGNGTSMPDSEKVVSQPTPNVPEENMLQAASNRPDPNSGQPDAPESPTASRSSSFEPKASTQAPLSRENLPATPKTGFQNSVELLADSAVEQEAKAGKNGPAPLEATQSTRRTATVESNGSEAPTNKPVEKNVQSTPTFDQSPRQDQGQERAPVWFKDNAQMNPTPVVSSTEQAAETFSTYVSSLTSEVAQRIQELYRQKRHELTLELEPKHLGRLLVKIGTDDNQVSALIATESEQIKELLSKSAPSLRQELASQGLVLEKLQIDVNSQATAQDQAFQQRNPARPRSGSNRQQAPSGKGLAEADVRRVHIANTQTLISLFV